MKKSGLVLSALAAFAFFGFQGPVSAHGKGECKADIENFCKGIEHGQGRIRECLQQNKDRLSSSCQAKIERVKQRHVACKADKEKLCKEVKPGEGRIRACMKDHQAELSAQCRAAIGA